MRERLSVWEVVCWSGENCIGRMVCGCMGIFKIVGGGSLVFSHLLQISTRVLNSNPIPKFTPKVI